MFQSNTPSAGLRPLKVIIINTTVIIPDWILFAVSSLYSQGLRGLFILWENVTCINAPLSANGRPARGRGLAHAYSFRSVGIFTYVVVKSVCVCVRVTCWPWLSPVRAGSVSATSPGFRASAPATDSTGRPVLLPLFFKFKYSYAGDGSGASCIQCMSPLTLPLMPCVSEADGCFSGLKSDAGKISSTNTRFCFKGRFTRTMVVM